MKHLVSLVYPPCCASCDTPLGMTGPVDGSGFGEAGPWCDVCLERLRIGRTAQCLHCAAESSLASGPAEDCPWCRHAGLQFDRAVAVGMYAGLLRELVIRMKNQHDERLADQLGRLLAATVVQQPGWERANLVVAVPTHWSRRLIRGFVAAEILAEVIARQSGIPWCPRAVSCRRRTSKQGRLSMHGRLLNVKHAFQWNPKQDFSGKRVLLVDDVMTSGATTSELARGLKQRGAAAVQVAVVARGIGAR